MGEPNSIAVVGGGIAGASVAEHLCAETNADVTVFERNERLAAETTDTSGGFFAYAPGDSPVDVRLKRYAFQRYNEFLSDSTMPYRYVGRVHVATTPERAEELRAIVHDADSIRASDTGSHAAIAGTPVQYLDGTEASRRLLLPTLDPDAIEGVLVRPVFGHLPPADIAREFVDRAVAAGASFQTGKPVERITTENGRATGIVTDGDHVAADAVVAAAGPWNPRLLRTAGIDPPVRHSVAPALVLDPQTDVDRWTPSVKHEESGYYFRQNADGTLFVGHNPGTFRDVGRELDPDEVSVPEGMYEAVRAVLERVAPGLGRTTIVDKDVGVRCLTPDGRPIVGWTAVEGVSMVAFNASGIHHAPIAGRIIARQLVHDDPTEHYDAVSITRFDGYDDARP